MRGHRHITAWRIAVLLAVGFTTYIGICWSRARFETMPASFMLLDRHGDLLAQIGGSDATGYGYWPAPADSDRVVQALLALEDRRFWSHPGVDPIAVARAALQDISSGRRLSGASSIAMQVARLQHPAPRTWLNKAFEVGTALTLTLRYGRAAVLAQYLRIVPFGNNGHGIAYASRLYFDKPAADLSWAEIALLAAIPQAPGRMNPLTSEVEQEQEHARRASSPISAMPASSRRAILPLRASNLRRLPSKSCGTVRRYPCTRFCG